MMNLMVHCACHQPSGLGPPWTPHDSFAVAFGNECTHFASPSRPRIRTSKYELSTHRVTNSPRIEHGALQRERPLRHHVERRRRRQECTDDGHHFRMCTRERRALEINPTDRHERHLRGC